MLFIWSGRRESNPCPKLGKLKLIDINAQIGGFFAFFEFFKWIPIGAVTEVSVLVQFPFSTQGVNDSNPRSTMLAGRDSNWQPFG